MKEFIIQSNEANQRFDKYLKKLLPNASTGFLFKMLRKKNITLNEKKAEGTELTKVGDIVKIFFSDDTFEKFAGNQDLLQMEYQRLKELPMAGLEIIYENEDMLVANKPFNMLSQKATEKDTSANEYLLGYLIRSGELSFETYKTFKPSVCNRLDRNTTGLILMGKSLKGLQYLSSHLKNREIKKYYRALVSGKMTEDAYLKGYLLKDEATNKVEIFDERKENSHEIETGYRVLETYANSSYIEIHLVTGKTHQIRAHLASIHHPIIGDMKYGNKKTNTFFYEDYHVTHQQLHAYRLEFPDGLVLTAEEPKMMTKCLNTLRKEK